MKFATALKIMEKELEPAGYMVSFEWIKGAFLESDHFPDKHAGEQLILLEEQAWQMAEQFAVKTRGKTCNFYVVTDDFSPVKGCRDRMIKNR
jgi:hypothetical protein